MTNARMIRMAVAIEAGQAAGRLYKAGQTPNGEGNPEEFGSNQWAEACGFADEKSLFWQGFASVLRPSR